MNVIVSNKFRDMLNSLDYDISKNITGEFSVDEIISTFANFYFNRMFLDITAIKDYKDLYNIQKLSINLDMSKVILILDDNEFCSSPQFLSQLISMGIYNFTKDKNGIIYLYDHPNVYRDVAHLHNINNQLNVNNVVNQNIGSNNSINNNDNVQKSIIIGVKNLTSHAGATSLVYMLKQVLSKYYSVKAIEVNKRDFMYYRDENMVSLSSSELNDFVFKNNMSNLLIIDLNDCDGGICTDVLYLVEPSIIKLNKLIMIVKNALKKRGDKKIILNKSFLSQNDVKDFENESEINIFYNIPPLNDRNINEDILLNLVNKLGLLRKV